MHRALGHLVVALLTFFLISESLADEGAPACVRSKEAMVQLDKERPRKLKSPSKKTNAVQRASAKPVVKRPKGSLPAEPPLKLAKFTPVNWTGEREGSWFQIQTFDGKLLWIRRKDLSFSWICLQVVVGQSRMYGGPGPTFPKMDIAQKGDVFRDHGGEDGYTRVENAEGRINWINLDHTWKPTSRFRMSFQPDKD
jgi:hypothetical protein